MNYKSDFEFRSLVYSCKKSHQYDSGNGIGLNYFVRMKQGISNFRGDGFDFTFVPNDVFFIPLGCKYKSYWNGDENVWDSIGFSLFPQYSDYKIQPIAPQSGMHEMLDKIMAQEAFDVNSVALLYSLIGMLLPSMKSNRSQKNAIIDKATEFMRTHISASIPEVAEHCCINESTLYAFFRSIGTTPVKTRLNIQLENAIMLLSTTDLSVSEISEKCGFNSTSYFYKVMKSLKGQHPSDFRYFM